MGFNEKMTALADEVRTLSGVTEEKSLDDLISDTTAANGEVDAQTELIGQIMTALDGKAGGSGDGDGSIETCTVSISEFEFATSTITIYFLQSDGNVNSDTVISAGQTVTLSVAKGFIIVQDSYKGDAITGLCSEGIEQIVSASGCSVFNVTKDGTIQIF